MGRNKLFGIRLPQDYINALELRYPGKPIVEAIRLTLGESLGLLSTQSIPSQSLDVIGTVNELLADIYKRLAVLEAIQVEVTTVNPDNQVNPDKPPVEDVIRTLKFEGKTRVMIRDEINKRGYRLDNGNKYRNEEVREILSQLDLT